MAMFRRSRRSTSPLRHKQQEIARQEAELREKLERLERMVAQGATVQNKSPARMGQRDLKPDKTEKRFHVSIALQSEQASDASRGARSPRSLRKVRREGRIIFLFLLIALAVAVIWLISHLHS